MFILSILYTFLYFSLDRKIIQTHYGFSCTGINEQTGPEAASIEHARNRHNEVKQLKTTDILPDKILQNKLLK